jgi:hypothetical protein
MTNLTYNRPTVKIEESTYYLSNAKMSISAMKKNHVLKSTGGVTYIINIFNSFAYIAI